MTFYVNRQCRVKYNSSYEPHQTEAFLIFNSTHAHFVVNNSGFRDMAERLGTLQLTSERREKLGKHMLSITLLAKFDLDRY